VQLVLSCGEIWMSVDRLPHTYCADAPAVPKVREISAKFGKNEAVTRFDYDFNAPVEYGGSR
jgi:hypothetical protein